MMLFNKSSIKLGTFVRTQHGHTGRVHELHLYGCPENRVWVAQQSIPVTDEQLEGVWASILTQPSGSVVQPVDTLEIIEPFELGNPWAAEYFE